MKKPGVASWPKTQIYEVFQGFAIMIVEYMEDLEKRGYSNIVFGFDDDYKMRIYFENEGFLYTREVSLVER